MTNTDTALLLACIEATRCLADFEGGDNELETLSSLHNAEHALMTAMTASNEGDDTSAEATNIYDLALNICELIENAIH